MSFAMRQEIDKIRCTCMLCGRCSKACPSFRHGGIDPMEIMAGGDQALDKCILCGTCSRICKRSDPFKVIRDLIYMEQGLSVSDTYKQTGFVRAPAEDRCVEPEWTGTDAYVMTGCVINGMAPYIEFAASVAMEAIGVRASRLPRESCCLHPVQFMGLTEGEKRSSWRDMCSSADGKDIITLCAGCSEEIETAEPSVSHIARYLYARLDSLPRFEKRLKVGMEPGCSAEPFAKEMAAVLERMNCEVVNREFGCCGKNAPAAGALMAEREDECSKAELIVVGCPMCFVKFDSSEGGRPVVHIAELVAMAAGRRESLAFHKIPVEAGLRGSRSSIL